MNKNALIIFAKNLVYGKVKTRLAASIGNDAAFSIYKALLNYTRSVADLINADKIVFYSDKIEHNDEWDNDYSKAIQHGKDLGERMKNAFKSSFKNDYNKAVVIGSDCPSLTEQIIEDAFEMLNEKDVVIGPAYDGGYYLLGIKKLHPHLFENIHWSTPYVLDETISVCNKNNLDYFLLPALHDIDEEKDLIHFKKAIV
jgi:rSAM/selenodomain-associated transferase 1